MDTLAPSHSAARALQLTGSTTMLPRMQRVAELYMQRQLGRIVINGGCGSARGYKALLDGTTDIAMASGAAPDDAIAAAQARRLVWRSTVVTQDAIVPVVHAANPLARLSLLQLQNIYTGRIVNWRQVGGPDAPIEVLLGPPGGGVANGWRRCMLVGADTFTAQARVMAAPLRLARVGASPYAIAYVSRTALPARRVKTLQVDASAAAALRAPMMLVTLGAAGAAAAAEATAETTAAAGAAAAKFIAWTVQSGALAWPGLPHE